MPFAPYLHFHTLFTLRKRYFLTASVTSRPEKQVFFIFAAVKLAAHLSAVCHRQPTRALIRVRTRRLVRTRAMQAYMRRQDMRCSLLLWCGRWHEAGKRLEAPNTEPFEQKGLSEDP